jgi:NTP pyrophosphatase (non-canonical NTP hydrolase)
VDFDDYQSAARRTENASLGERERLFDAAAGLAEEAGEVLGAIRKHAFQARPLERAAVIEELGDALWCLTTICSSLGVSLSDVANANLAKLERRYPETRPRAEGRRPRDSHGSEERFPNAGNTEE